MFRSALPHSRWSGFSAFFPAGRQLAAALAEVTDPGRLAQVGEWIIECGTAAELFARLADTPRRSQ